MAEASNPMMTDNELDVFMRDYPPEIRRKLVRIRNLSHAIRAMLREVKPLEHERRDLLLALRIEGIPERHLAYIIGVSRGAVAGLGGGRLKNLPRAFRADSGQSTAPRGNFDGGS